MIVEIPDKNLELEFPDDMDQSQIASIIQRDVYGMESPSFGRLAKKTGYAVRQGAGDVLSGFAAGAENAQRRQNEFGLGLREAVRRINPAAVSKERVPAFNADKAISSIRSAAGGMAMPERFQRPTTSGAYNFIEDAITGVAGSAPAMIATAVNPPAGIALMYEQILGGGYNKRVKAGADPDRAYIASALDAAAQAPLEYAGTILELGALKKMAGGKAIRYLRTVLQTAAAEGLEEGLQAIPEKIADIYAANPKKSNRELAKMAINEIASVKFAKEAGYQAAAGAFGGGLLGAGGGAVQSLRAPNIEVAQKDTVETRDNVADIILSDLQSNKVTPEELEAALPNLAPEQAQSVQSALATYRESLPPQRGRGLRPPRIQTVPKGEIQLPQPKSAQESAQVFEQAGQPRAEQAYDTFEREGVLKTARERNQEIIDRTNVEAENEIAQNRFDKLQDFYDLAHEAGRRGDPIPALKSSLVGELTEDEQNELKDSYESGKHIQGILTKAGIQEDEEDARRIFEEQEPSGEEIPQGRVEPQGGIEEGEKKRSNRVLVQTPQVGEQVGIKKEQISEVPPQASEPKAQPAPSPVAPSQKVTTQGQQETPNAPSPVEKQPTKDAPDNAIGWLYAVSNSVYDNINKSWIKPKREKIIQAVGNLTNSGVRVEYIPPNSPNQAEIWRFRHGGNAYQLGRDPSGRTTWHNWHKPKSDARPIDKTPSPIDRRKQPIDMGGGENLIQSPKQVNGDTLPERRRGGRGGNAQQIEKVTEQFNAQNEGSTVKFDGIQDLSSIGKPPLYQFTGKEGVLKGASFSISDPTVETLKAKVDEMTQIWSKKQEKRGAIGRAWTGNQWKPITDQVEIKRGKNKGKMRVTFAGGKNRIVAPESIKPFEKTETKKESPTEKLKKKFKDQSGSSQIATDIINHGISLKQKGIESFRQFKSSMREKFSEVWDKIKVHMRELWGILSNQRGEIKIGQDDKSQDIINRYFKSGEPKPSDTKEVKKKQKSERFSEKLESLERPINDIMYWIADKNRPFNTIQRKLDNVSDEIDVFLKETQRPKVTAAKIKKIWDDQIEPMIKDMAKSSVNVQDLEEYKHALHAPEANKALTESNAKRYLDDIMERVPTKKTKKLRDEMKALLDERKQLVKQKKKQGLTALKYEAGLLPKDYLKFLKQAFDQFGNENGVRAIKKKWDTFTEKPSGMTDAESAEILKKYEGDENIERIGKQLDAINEERLDILRDAGLITDEEYQAYKNKYEHYVPLYREGYDDSIFGPSRGLKPSGRPIKVRGGSLRNVVNIMANSISNLEKAVNLAEKARSTKALRDLVLQNPDPDLWSIKREKKSPRYDNYGNIRMYPDIYNVNDNEMRFVVDGAQYFLEVNRDNKDAMLMIKTLKAVDSMHGPVVSALSNLNRHLARINTTWSPEFIISNFARDFQTANINIQDTGVKGKGMFKGAKNAIKAIYAVERGKPKGTKLEKLYERFKAAGGKIGWADVHPTVENLSKKLTREIEMQQGKRPIRSTIKQWGDFIEAANTSIENGIRLHVFKLATEQGKSDERAAQIASDITVDFTKKGAAGPLINSLYLFANAGIQGSYRILRAATKSRAVQKTLVGIIGAGFLAGLFNSLVGGEDEDGEDYYNKIDDYIRERNAIFVIPGTSGKFVKIPLPWGYNLFWNIGAEASMAFTKEHYKPMEGAMRLMSTFANAFNPIQSGTLLQTLAPTVADPFVQVAENKNWFGGQLMPDQNKFDKTPTPDSQRYWKSNRIGSVWVANQLNKLTGGDKIKPGGIDVSPATLDLIIDTAGGSALRFFTDTGGLPIAFARGERPQIHKYPFIRRVFGGQPEWGDSRIYYSNLTEVLTAKEQLDAYRGTPYYKYLEKETTRQQKMFGMAKSIEKRLRKLRKVKKSREASGQDVSDLDKQIKDLYIKFNRSYNEASE